jgi:hypothetical protein
MTDLERLVGQLDSLDPESLAEVASFVDYLKWRQGIISGRGAGQPWAFDFVEHFRPAMASAEREPSGMEVQVSEASCDGDSRMALWQHPPVRGAAIVEYQVPIPANVGNLCLRFATGIRDGSQLAEGNVVAFRVFVNDWKIWSDTQHARSWKGYEIAMPAVSGDVARIKFVTDGLGNHEWAWAAWGEPKLVGEITE